MAGKILVLRWAGSAYDSLGGLLELTADALAAEGFQVVLFEATGADWPQKLGALLGQGGFTLALTMSGNGTDLMLDGRLVWEVAKVPLFNWNCDHPCYFPARHVMRNAFLLHGYVFPDHARYNVGQLNANGAAFAVHLGMPPRSLFAGAPLSLAARNGRILFSKSGQDPNTIEAKWRTCPELLRAVLFAAAEQLTAASTGDFLATLQRIGASHGLLLTGNNKLTLLLMSELDAYVRYRRASSMMQAVLRYPVDVFGAGWEHIAPAATGARFHGATSWREVVARLPGYLGCLSINPLVEESVHDRVFFALAAGVAPISDTNAFCRARLPGLERYGFVFGPDGFTRDGIARAVDTVLSDPTDALARAEQAWQALEGNFSLRRAVQQIVGFAALHVTNAPMAWAEGAAPG